MSVAVIEYASQPFERLRLEAVAGQVHPVLADLISRIGELELLMSTCSTV
jgi:hypothetical protein